MVGKLQNKVSGLKSLILLFLLALTAFKCDDERPPQFEFMIFELPFTIIPGNEVIQMGDTLWITSSMADSIKEYHSDNFYKIENFNFNFSLGLFQLTGNQKSLGEQPGATTSFHFVQEIGTITYFGETFSDFNLVYAQEKYLSRIGIIPQSLGVFSVNFLGPSELELNSVIDLGVTEDGRQRIPVYEALFFIINEGNTNFDLFTENCLDTSTNPDNYREYYYIRKGTFTFRVVL